MNLSLIKAPPELKNVFNNLMQFYIYDFSAYIECDVDDNGKFPDYAGLDDYWKNESNKFPYLIKKDDRYIGFVLVSKTDAAINNYWSIAEFFILSKYRRLGAGRLIATQVFNLHRGRWQVHQRMSNQPAQIFWTKVIAEYTNGKFAERYEGERRFQHFEN